MKRCAVLWMLAACCGGLMATGGGDDAAGLPKTMTTKTGVDMVLVPAGQFTMGNDGGKPDEKPRHKVSVSAFYMDTYEVRQSDFEKMTGSNPSKFGGTGYPVDQVRWFEAAQYCNERSRREGLAPCYDEESWACDFEADGYRLPTEAEWEYACRGGTQTAYPFGDSPEKLKFFAWFKANSGKKSHAVGEMKPNPFGLHDMLGNLREWCNDFYAADYYGASPDQDPRGPVSGKKRVLRGGCWAGEPDTCLPARRYSDDPANADICLGYDIYGFRCVRRATAGK